VNVKPVAEVPLCSEGLPYIYEAFDVVGECAAPPVMWGWYQECTLTAPDPRRRELTPTWKLIRFND
jgi:hypothetical protein